ncbi:Esa1p-associated factor [Massospora cicadina]|nr:Esa1p-associated factor [Massospora cicadina]
MSSSRRVRSNPARASEELATSNEARVKKKVEREDIFLKSDALAATATPVSFDFEFEKDERILCYHGPLLYEAKAEYWDANKLLSSKGSLKKPHASKGWGKDFEDLPGPRYQIHYKGWKQRWDEWVTSSRILKWTPANLDLQEKLNKKVAISKTRKQIATSTATAPSATSPKSPTPKPSPLTTRAARNSLKSETPSVQERSPSVATPEVPAQTRASRPKRKLSEPVGIRSKRLQAIRSQQAVAESPKSAAPEAESTSRLRSASNKPTENDSELESVLETTSDSEKLTSSASETPSTQAPPPVKTKPAPVDSQRNRRKGAREEPVANGSTPKERAAPIWEGPPRIDLPIPNKLKLHLIDQWDYISRSQELVPLPRKPSVRQILAEYREHAVRTLLAGVGPTEAPQGSLDGELPAAVKTKIDVIHEVVDGIALYFAKTLGSFLLYRFERPQHARLMALYPKARLYPQPGDSDPPQQKRGLTDFKASDGEFEAPAEADWDLLDIYGAEHLLRLFAYLPMLLSRSDLDPEGLSRIKVLLEDILAYLDSRRSELFLDQFETAPPSYTKVVKME